jgi:hypothetical protein
MRKRAAGCRSGVHKKQENACGRFHGTAFFETTVPPESKSTIQSTLTTGKQSTALQALEWFTVQSKRGLNGSGLYQNLLDTALALE